MKELSSMYSIEPAPTSFRLEGDRSAVREGATTAVLALAVGLLDASADR